MLDYQQFNDTKVTAGTGATKADAAWKALFSSDRTNAPASDDGPDFFEATYQYDASYMECNQSSKRC